MQVWWANQIPCCSSLFCSSSVSSAPHLSQSCKARSKFWLSGFMRSKNWIPVDNALAAMVDHFNSSCVPSVLIMMNLPIMSERHKSNPKATSALVIRRRTLSRTPNMLPILPSLVSSMSTDHNIVPWKHIWSAYMVLISCVMVQLKDIPWSPVTNTIVPLVLSLRRNMFELESSVL